MRKSLHVLGVLLATVALLLQMTPISAANRHAGWRKHNNQVNHFITAGASAGYSTLIENYSDLNTKGTIGGTLGLGYELRINKFLLTTGVEAQLVTAKDSFALPNFTQNIIDTQGKLAIMNYRFAPIEESHQLLYVSIPLMVGVYHRGFYLSAGAKIGFAVQPITSMEVAYETSGTYGEYIEDFADMSNNGYGEYTDTKQYKHEGLPIRTSALAEIGYDVMSPVRKKDATQRNGVRIGVVCEYGLNNIVKTVEPANSIVINKTNANDVTVLPYYQTHAITGRRVSNLYVGLKITWIFDFSSEPCDCEE